jgi:hypothetical protein
MTTRKFFPALNVGMAQTFGGGVAIGGDGKWDERVKTVAKAHGLKMHQHTGEWHTADGSRFAEILAALESA